MNQTTSNKVPENDLTSPTQTQEEQVLFIRKRNDSVSSLSLGEFKAYIAAISDKYSYGGSISKIIKLKSGDFLIAVPSADDVGFLMEILKSD